MNSTGPFGVGCRIIAEFDEDASAFADTQAEFVPVRAFRIGCKPTGEAMNDKVTQPAEGFGLLANGSSRRWDIAVDESLDREEWSLEIDGPQVYVVFQLKDLKVIPAALRFLQAGIKAKRSQAGGRRHENESDLSLGKFGSASVSLAWDNEDFPRCFLIIGPRARATLRLSFEGDDIQMLIEALGEVVKDLPEAPAKGKGAP
jgi:hypothetical protein